MSRLVWIPRIFLRGLFFPLGSLPVALRPQPYVLPREAGFGRPEYRQTLFGHPDKMQDPDPVRRGSGQGAFVVACGRKERTSSC